MSRPSLPVDMGEHLPTGRGEGQRQVSEAPGDDAEDTRSSAAAGAQHSQAAMRELSTARTTESQGSRDGDSLPSASSPLPDDGAEDDRSRSPEGAPGVPGVSIKMMEKFSHSAGAPRKESSSPPTLGADRQPDGHGPASWRPMAVGAAGFSASMAKFLHMQHKAATAACAGKRKHEETKDCGGEDPAGVWQSASCSTDKALASGYKTSPGYCGEKAARHRSESPSSSEHPLSINSTSSLLHSVNRAVPEDASHEDVDGADKTEGGF